MIWTFVILIVGYVIYKFFNSLEQDKDELNSQKLSEKFSAIINMLNDAAFNGKGDINVEDSRNLNIYENDSNQIVQLQYSTGSLTITWKYKYYQKEVVYKKNFTDARNLSLFEQKKIAESVINNMSKIVEKHKSDVIRNKPKTQNELTNDFIKQYKESQSYKDYLKTPQGILSGLHYSGDLSEGLREAFKKEGLKQKYRKSQEETLITILNGLIMWLLSNNNKSWEESDKITRINIIEDCKNQCIEYIMLHYVEIKNEFELNDGIFCFSKIEYEDIGNLSIKNFAETN